MVVYYVGSRRAVGEVKRHGFTDGVRMVQHPQTGRRWAEHGVWLSDSPAPDQHHNLAGLADADFVALAVPDGRLRDYELHMPGMDRRRFYVPSVVANQYLTVGHDPCKS